MVETVVVLGGKFILRVIGMPWEGETAVVLGAGLFSFSEMGVQSSVGTETMMVLELAAWQS